MFARQRQKTKNAELERLRTRAAAAMVAGEGFFNVSPWSFVIGLIGAIFATLLIVDWLLPDESRVPSTAPAPTPPDGEVWIDVE